MDDTFFSVVLENKEACEYLLSALIGKKITVIENKTQYSIRNTEGHSIVLDALVEDKDHNLYDVEVQVGDRKNYERRIRYYRTAIDWSYLEKGVDYAEMPELYMIFISDFDPFGLNKNHYEIKQYVDDTDTPYDDGIHRLYFNTAVQDDTGLSKLLQYLAKSNSDSGEFGALSKTVNYHKYINEGVDTMCKAVEDYAKIRMEESRLAGKNEGKVEKAVEIVRNMLKDGLALEKALQYADIDMETYKKHSERMQ